MKKLIGLVLAFALSCACFSACAAGSGQAIITLSDGESQLCSVTFSVGDRIFPEDLEKALALSGMRTEAYFFDSDLTQELNFPYTVSRDVTLYVQPRPIKDTVTVTFWADGIQIDSAEVSYGGSLEKLPDIPQKEGFDATWDTLDFSNLTQELAVTAVYTRRVLNVTFVADGQTVATRQVSYGSPLTDIPAVPEKEGHTGEWNITDFSEIKQDLTVNAVYTANILTVTFVAGGQTVATRQISYGSPLTDIPDVPEKEGHTGEWNVTDFSEIKQDLTVNAVYTANILTVTFVAAGQTVATRQVLYGSPLTDIPAVPEKVGHTGAWSVTDFSEIKQDLTVNAVYTAKTMTVTFVAAGQTVATRQVLYGSPLTDIPAVPEKVGHTGAWSVTDFSEIKQDLTVNAVYTAKTMTVTFVADGQTVATRQVSYGSTLTDIPAVPEKEGHTGEWNVTDFSEIKQNLTVNAVYKIKTMTVTFVADGQTVATRQVSYGSPLTDIPGVPEKEGHTGIWNETDFSEIRQDLTVNAVYTAKTMTVTFVADGQTVATRQVSYGSTLTDIPTVPEKEGHTGEWNITDFSEIRQDLTVQAVYRIIILKVTYLDGSAETVIDVEYGGLAPERAGSGADFRCWMTENGAAYDFSLPVTADLKLTAYYESQEIVYDCENFSSALTFNGLLVLTYTGSAEYVEVPDSFTYEGETYPTNRVVFTAESGANVKRIRFLFDFSKPFDAQYCPLLEAVELIMAPATSGTLENCTQLKELVLLEGSVGLSVKLLENLPVERLILPSTVTELSVSEITYFSVNELVLNGVNCAIEYLPSSLKKLTIQGDSAGLTLTGNALKSCPELEELYLLADAVLPFSQDDLPATVVRIFCRSDQLHVYLERFPDCEVTSAD